MKEIPLLYGKRPFAVCSTSDAKVDCQDNLLDEEIALKLGFPIQQLQYSRLKLNGNIVRICVIVRVTVQKIKNGKSDQSVPFLAKVVRDLCSVTGTDAVGSAELFQKISLISKADKNCSRTGVDTDQTASSSSLLVYY